MDGFTELVHDLLVESGLRDATIFRKSKVELPGFFHPTKEWDLLVVIDRILLAPTWDLKLLVAEDGSPARSPALEEVGCLGVAEHMGRGLDPDGLRLAPHEHAHGHPAAPRAVSRPGRSVAKPERAPCGTCRNRPPSAG